MNTSLLLWPIFVFFFFLNLSNIIYRTAECETPKESVVCLKKEIPKEKKTLTGSHAIAPSGDWGKIKKGKDGTTAC